MVTKSTRNDFWLIAPWGWGGEENMITVLKSEASTALKAIEVAGSKRYYSPEGNSLQTEMQNHATDQVFVYEAKEVGTYERVAWRKVGT